MLWQLTTGMQACMLGNSSPPQMTNDWLIPQILEFNLLNCSQSSANLGSAESL